MAYPLIEQLKAMTPRRAQVIDWVSEVGDALQVRCALVGGCVRDVVLDAPVGDFDFVVEGDSKAFAQTLVRHHGGRLQVHPAFGTVTWMTVAGDVDFAMARTEVYRAPGALPDVTPAILEEDLRRRDFSVNAMALVVSATGKGTRLDPFDGLADLKKRTLRVLHPASFVDDPTRAWRAARYEGRLGLTWAKETEEAWTYAQSVQAPQTVTVQRYGNEWDKVCAESDVAAVLEVLERRGILEAIHPAFPSVHGLAQTLGAVDAAANGPCLGWLESRTEALWIRLAMDVPDATRHTVVAFASGVHGRTDRWLQGPQRLRDTLAVLQSHDDRGHWGHAIAMLSGAELLVLFTLDKWGQEAVRWWMEDGRACRSVVTAQALLARDVPAGPGLGAALRAAQAAAWRGDTEDQQWTAAFHAAKH